MENGTGNDAETGCMQPTRDMHGNAWEWVADGITRQAWLRILWDLLRLDWLAEELGLATLLRSAQRYFLSSFIGANHVRPFGTTNEFNDMAYKRGRGHPQPQRQRPQRFSITTNASTYSIRVQAKDEFNWFSPTWHATGAVGRICGTNGTWTVNRSSMNGLCRWEA